MSKVVSNFSKGADDWTVEGDPKTAAWIKSDGDPGGYFGWSNGGETEISYYQAPAKFLGNDKSYYGGTLSYDIVTHSNSDDPYKQGYADVILYDGKHELAAISSRAVESTWTGMVFSLKAGDLYDVDSSGNATLASKSEIKAVLGHLEFLGIRAEYYGGAETGGIDNVILHSGGLSAPPAAPPLAHLGAAQAFAAEHPIHAMPFTPHILSEAMHLALT